MADILVVKPTGTHHHIGSDTGFDHSEAALSFSGRASSDASAHSSLADELPRAPGSPSSRMHAAGKLASHPLQPPHAASRSPAPAAPAAPQQQHQLPPPPRQQPETPLPQGPPCCLHVMVAGRSGLGKTRVIEELARLCGASLPASTRPGSPGRTAPRPGGGSAPHSSPRPALARICMLERNPSQLTTELPPRELPGQPGRPLHVSLLDVPSYDCETNKALHLAKLLEYILRQRERDYRATFRPAALALSADEGGGGRPLLHSAALCLYFLPPHEVSATDLTLMSALSHEVPLLPVLSLGGIAPLGAAAAGMGGDEEREEQERVAALQRAVEAALMSYIRNGAPAPIVPVELDPASSPRVLTAGGREAAAGREAERLLWVLQGCVDPVVRAAESRFEEFCERYEAYGQDLMGLLAEAVDCHEGPLKAALRSDAAAAAAAAASPPRSRTQSPVPPHQPPVAAAVRSLPAAQDTAAAEGEEEEVDPAVAAAASATYCAATAAAAAAMAAAAAASAAAAAASAAIAALPASEDEEDEEAEEDEVDDSVAVDAAGLELEAEEELGTPPASKSSPEPLLQPSTPEQYSAFTASAAGPRERGLPPPLPATMVEGDTGAVTAVAASAVAKAEGSEAGADRVELEAEKVMAAIEQIVTELSLEAEAEEAAAALLAAAALSAAPNPRGPDGAEEEEYDSEEGAEVVAAVVQRVMASVKALPAEVHAAVQRALASTRAAVTVLAPVVSGAQGAEGEGAAPASVRAAAQAGLSSVFSAALALAPFTDAAEVAEAGALQCAMTAALEAAVALTPAAEGAADNGSVSRAVAAAEASSATLSQLVEPQPVPAGSSSAPALAPDVHRSTIETALVSITRDGAQRGAAMGAAAPAVSPAAEVPSSETARSPTPKADGANAGMGLFSWVLAAVSATLGRACARLGPDQVTQGGKDEAAAAAAGEGSVADTEAEERTAVVHRVAQRAVAAVLAKAKTEAGAGDEPAVVLSEEGTPAKDLMEESVDTAVHDMVHRALEAAVAAAGAEPTEEEEVKEEDVRDDVDPAVRHLVQRALAAAVAEAEDEEAELATGVPREVRRVVRRALAAAVAAAVGKAAKTEVEPAAAAAPHAVSLRASACAGRPVLTTPTARTRTWAQRGAEIWGGLPSLTSRRSSVLSYLRGTGSKGGSDGAALVSREPGAGRYYTPGLNVGLGVGVGALSLAVGAALILHRPRQPAQ